MTDEQEPTPQDQPKEITGLLVSDAKTGLPIASVGFNGELQTRLQMTGDNMAKLARVSSFIEEFGIKVV